MEAGGRLVVKVDNWTDEWNIWPTGDWHLVARGCNENLLDATLEAIHEDPHGLWCGMGDLGDLVSHSDRRFDPENIAEKDRKGYFQKLGPYVLNRILEKVMPIADKCLFMLRGNHEFTYEQRFEQAIIKSVVQRMNEDLERRGSEHRIPFLGYSGFRDVVFKKGRRMSKFRICAHHGAGFAVTKGGKLNRLGRFMNYFSADLYFMGHVHTATDDVVTSIGANDDCTHIVAKSRLGVVTGTFLKTYAQGPSGYGERAMYEPVPLGSPVISICPGTRELSVTKPCS